MSWVIYRRPRPSAPLLVTFLAAALSTAKYLLVRWSWAPSSSTRDAPFHHRSYLAVCTTGPGHHAPPRLALWIAVRLRESCGAGHVHHQLGTPLFVSVRV
jgi:hypothetical protein